MTSAERSAEESSAGRRILRAAEELFKKAGYRGVTMELVADDAAVSKATVYAYFRNKDELFLTVCARMANLLVQEFGEALEGGGESLDDRLRAAIVAKHRLTFKLVRTSPYADELFSHKARVAGEIFAEAEEAMLTQIARLLATDQDLQPSARQLARALLLCSAELAARSNSATEMETDVAAFVTVHLAGARAVAGQVHRVADGVGHGQHA